MKTTEEKKQKKASRQRTLFYTFVGAFIFGVLLTSCEIYWLSKPKPENLSAFVLPIILNIVGAILCVIYAKVMLSSGKKEKDPKEL